MTTEQIAKQAAEEIIDELTSIHHYQPLLESIISRAIAHALKEQAGDERELVEVARDLRVAHLHDRKTMALPDLIGALKSCLEAMALSREMRPGLYDDAAGEATEALRKAGELE